MNQIRRRGFTLIELLVVICILGILMALVLTYNSHSMNLARTKVTEGLLQSLSAALATYQLRWGDYPPTSLSEIGGRNLNDTNNGVESLVACLASTRKGPKLYAPPTLEGYLNTDGDKADSNLTGWYYAVNDLWEYADGFGNPLIYMHHRDYARPRGGMTAYILEAGGGKVEIGPELSPKLKTFANADRYQLRSVGLDGRPGTADDLSAGDH